MLAQVYQITLIQNVYKKHEYCIKAVCNILVSGIHLAIMLWPLSGAVPVLNVHLEKIAKQVSVL